MKLINLHTNTTYSFLESTIELDKLIDWAKQNNTKYLAITERGNMFSFASFCVKAKQNNIKTIYGIQITTRQEATETELIVIAKNLDGLKELFELNLKHNIEGFLSQEYLMKFKNLIFIDHPTYGLFRKTQCFYTEIDTYVAINLDVINQLKNIDLNNEKFLYVNESRVFDALDNTTLETLYWIKNQTESDNKAFVDSLTCEVETNDPQIINIINKTNELAKSLAFEVPLSKFKMPVYKNSHGVDSYTYLKEIIAQNISWKLKNAKNANEYKDRMKYELSIIKELGFEDYFLIIWDFINWAKNNNISIGPGRGSAAGSLISYLMNITQIDPIKYHLLFERFLNPKRVSLPDIDIDVQDDQRGRLIEYLVEKYGYNKVASIVTFSTLGTKSSMRDSARSMNIPNPFIDFLAKKIPTGDLNLKQVYEQSYGFRDEINKYKNPETGQNDLQAAYDVACKIEGFYRQSGTHAAGIIISEEDIVNRAPVMVANDHLQTQIPMDYLEIFGLLKIDILGLKTLTIINDIIMEIKKHASDFDIDKISLDDKDTFKLLSAGKTAGIFQLESGGMRKTLMKVKVTDFNDIAAIISLFRPGPMQHIDTYANRKNGKEKVPSIDPIYDQVLQNTYGIMIYQEQILQLVQKISKMDYAEADLLRRAISKKKVEEFAKFKEIFITKAIENNYSEKLANDIFANIEKFAEYGFNKSHAVSYSLITYRMAYLKAHYPLEFYSAIISSSINSIDNLNKYVSEAQELGIEIVSPTINDSEAKSVIKDKKIFLPFTMIKGFGKVGVESLVNERKQNGPYKTLIEAFLRLKCVGIGDAALKILVKANVFRDFENQVSILRSLEDSTPFKFELFNAYNPKTKTIDYQNLNTSVTPIHYEYDFELESKNEILYLGNCYNSSITKRWETSTKLINIHPGTQHIVAVYIQDAVVRLSKYNKPYTFVKMSDSSASITAIIWKDSEIKELIGKLAYVTVTKKMDLNWRIDDFKEIKE